MSKTALAILGLLSEQPMHGYEIKQTVKDRWMDMWALISLPSIYNTLNRLAEQKYINASKEKIGKTPERNVFTISDKGRHFLVELVEKGLGTGKIKIVDDLPFWLAVAFIHHTDTATALKALHGRVKSLEESCTILRDQHRDCWDTIPFNWQAIIVSGLEHMKLEIKHIQHMIEHLKKTEEDTVTQAHYAEIINSPDR